MKAREFEKLGKQLLPHLDGFIVREKWIVRTPVRHAMGAIVFNPTSMPVRFTVLAIVVPLFLPTATVYFNVGRELQPIGGGLWDRDDPALVSKLRSSIAAQGLPLLSRIDTLEGIADAALSMSPVRSESVVMQKTIVYACILVGNIPRALREIDESLRILGNRTRSPEWVAELLRLKASLPADVDRLARNLRATERETARTLRIEDLVACHEA